MILLAAVLGCGGDPPPATFAEIYPLLFPVETKPQCNFCHSLPPNQKSNGMLSMGTDPATAYAALIGATGHADCEAMPYIVPGDPSASLFYLKLAGIPPCGSRMPLGGSQLSQADVDMVASWISAGAEGP